MKYRPTWRATPYVISIAATIFTMTALSDPLRAQPRHSAMSDRSRDLLERERQLREIEKPIRPLQVSEQRMLLEQINKDFARIQFVEREMVKAISDEAALDVKKVRKATDEIKTLAIRLKTNLLLPGNEDAKLEIQVGRELKEVRAALFHLSKTVRSFAHNPVFQSSSNVVDAQLSAQARSDLVTIIKLCQNIKKSAEKMVQP